MSPRPVDIVEIAQLMNDDCENLVAELIPDAERQGGVRLICRGLLGGRGDQTSIHLVGGTRGRYKCFGGVDIPGAPESGDMLDLVAWLLFDGNKKLAFQWGLQRYGFSDRGPDAAARLDARRREAARRQAERTAKAAAEAEERVDRAFYAWRALSRPIVAADGAPTLAARYLTGTRGIDLARIPSHGALKFIDKLAPRRGDPEVPCMMSIMVDAEGKARACHRTALEELADGQVVKSRRVGSPKTIQGKPKGAFIAINRGASDKTMRNAPEGDALLICEGLEDALTLTMAAPGMRIVAAGTLSNMGEVAPPPAISRLILYRDRDDKPAAIAAFERALEKQLERARPIGRAISIAEPPAGFKDANAALTGDRQKGAA